MIQLTFGVEVLKRCSKCGIEKGGEEFFTTSYDKGKLRPECKTCGAEQQKEYRARNSVQLRERGRAYKSKQRASVPEYRTKRRVHARVRLAIKAGKLARQPCEVCGAEPAEAHHDDYGQPLAVRWLCRKHHMAWHAANGDAANGGADTAQP